MPFLNGVPLTGSEYLFTFILLIWLLPIFSLLFYVSGFLKSSTNKYGILLLTRNYNKGLYVVKKIISIVIIVKVEKRTHIISS